ncbi:uncharacterized protein LOC113553334 [Rhopalosiphum maidis]|uniref:uncharacterized protein LOC113553334 n=1 Tax=Rhopalosiphum maidis TaxID=43146 RepID=UPI000EFDB93D|nr:uncharacterized protein LOC113553334 [Rhopalosiphum maidis]
MSRLVTVVFAVAIASSLVAAEQPEARKIDTGLGDFKVVFKVFQDCSKAQFGPCLKHKLLTALDRISEQPEMELFDGVRLVKDPAVALNDVANDMSSARSASDDETTGLDTLVIDRVMNFFKSRSLQFKLLDNESREMGDGRKKSNKYNSLLMYPFMMGGMTIPLAFGVLALLAGKALIIAKLALALSAIVGLKKLFSDQGGSSHEYITHGGSGGHYRRSLPGEPISASNMAYSSYMPVYEEPIRSTTSNAIPLR